MPNPNNNPGLNTGYVLHHNGPQYFGYLADNPQVLDNNLHGAKDFFDAVEGRKLPAKVEYIYDRLTPSYNYAFSSNTVNGVSKTSVKTNENTVRAAQLFKF